MSFIRLLLVTHVLIVSVLANTIEGKLAYHNAFKKKPIEQDYISIYTFCITKKQNTTVK